jgi:hypothetical protein
LRYYVAATGVVFALMFAAHVARAWVEGSALYREPAFVATSIFSLGLAAWAALLFFNRRR